MTHRKTLWIPALVVVVLALALTGCKKQKPVTPEEPQPAAQQQPTTPPPKPTTPPPKKTEVTEGFDQEPVVVAEVTEADIAALNEQGVLATVYFAFDSYELDDQNRMVLQQNADWLQDNPNYNIRVEGHCDERGTIEYNLALGERRASAVRDYLVSLGVDAFRIRIVSYGEEDPEDPGHDEAAWARNRRAVFVIES
jgi:peptidoglycan-associated lipoprotein